MIQISKQLQSDRAREVRRVTKNIEGKIMTTTNAPAKPATKQNPAAAVKAPTEPEQLHLTRRSPAYWRVTINNPPINVMGPEMVRQFQELIHEIETDEQVRVVVF